ncbi:MULTISPECIES: integrase [Micromonospora]|uniref:integrase n=1 Tax=Micromonospora TaxID=1873 RepID=UPI001F519299|nr:integrase [Micromonospora sp. TSRI0369]
MRFDKIVHTVVGVSGTLVLVADEQAEVTAIRLADLQARADFEVLGERSRAPALSATAVVHRLPQQVVDEALWWERHLQEVIHGLAPDAPAGSRPRAGYDPAVTTLTQRERAKAEELVAAGHAVNASKVKRQRQRYEAGGLAALVDQRPLRRPSRFGRADARVVEAMQTAIAEATDASTRTASFLVWRTGQILAQRPDADQVVVPSRATLYRLLGKLTAGLHTTGSARTRRSQDSRPDGPFRTVSAAAPGELVQIDSTPLDVLVLLDDGTPRRVELTGMIDVATRTVPAAVLRPTTKSVDASVLLARALTPEPMRPGWADALTMSRSVLPHRRLLAIDERLEHAAARPVIVPATIVVDQGKVFISRNFRASCAALGINFQPTHPGSPAEKPHIEKMMSAVGTLFAQFVSGYTGSNTERRGRKVEAQPLWSMLELQELLDEWLVAAWQNRPHDGLRDPAAPGRMFTPNEKYAALVESAGYVPVALSADDYIELLPACWKAINAYGVKLKHRTYDAEALNPLRRQPSGIATRKDLWEVHYDPYDVSRVWLRNHGDPQAGWITLFWKHLRRDGVPFGELAWDHVRAQMPKATEDEIAAAVQDLLRRASQGPQPATGSRASKRDRRVAARTRATTPRPEPVSDAAPASAPADEPDQDQSDGQVAKVIPLGSSTRIRKRANDGDRDDRRRHHGLVCRPARRRPAPAVDHAGGLAPLRRQRSRGP